MPHGQRSQRLHELYWLAKDASASDQLTTFLRNLSEASPELAHELEELLELDQQGNAAEFLARIDAPSPRP